MRCPAGSVPGRPSFAASVSLANEATDPSIIFTEASLLLITPPPNRHHAVRRAHRRCRRPWRHLQPSPPVQPQGAAGAPVPPIQGTHDALQGSRRGWVGGAACHTALAGARAGSCPTRPLILLLLSLLLLLAPIAALATRALSLPKPMARAQVSWHAWLARCVAEPPMLPTQPMQSPNPPSKYACNAARAPVPPAVLCRLLNVGCIKQDWRHLLRRCRGPAAAAAPSGQEHRARPS